MTAIRVIFDGKAFIPQQPLSLPAQSEALVIVEQADRSAQQQLRMVGPQYSDRQASNTGDEASSTSPARAWED
jgi:hypothetical protein